MSLISEYRAQIDSNKIQFFKELSKESKKELYDGLEKDEQAHLLFLLPFQYIKSFIFSLEKEEQKKIYAQLNNNQLKAIYNSLNESEKQEMEFTLEDRQIDFIRNIDQSMININTAKNEMENAQNQIINSRVQQANARIEIQKQKQELKDIKVQFKQLKKERKRTLQKIKHASKPSILDKIGLFSKRRMNKLMKVTNELEENNKKIDKLRNYNIVVNESIKNANEQIERERQNIIEAKEQILKSKYSIQENTKGIEEIKIEIKKLSQVEKNVLGKKLYRKKLDERNLLITKPNPHSLEIPVKEEKKVIEIPSIIEEKPIEDKKTTVSSKESSTTKTQNFLEIFSKLTEMGINFYPSTNIPMLPEGEILEEEPVTTITKTQLTMLSYMMAASIIIEQQRRTQLAQNQELSESYTKTLGNRGAFVSLTLLICILLFIFSLTLFFIA